MKLWTWVVHVTYQYVDTILTAHIEHYTCWCPNPDVLYIPAADSRTPRGDTTRSISSLSNLVTDKTPPHVLNAGCWKLQVEMANKLRSHHSSVLSSVYYGIALTPCVWPMREEHINSLKRVAIWQITIPYPHTKLFIKIHPWYDVSFKGLRKNNIKKLSD